MCQHVAHSPFSAQRRCRPLGLVERPQVGRESLALCMNHRPDFHFPTHAFPSSPYFTGLEHEDHIARGSGKEVGLMPLHDLVQRAAAAWLRCRTGQLPCRHWTVVRRLFRPDGNDVVVTELSTLVIAWSARRRRLGFLPAVAGAPGRPRACPADRAERVGRRRPWPRWSPTRSLDNQRTVATPKPSGRGPQPKW